MVGTWWWLAGPRSVMRQISQDVVHSHNILLSFALCFVFHQPLPVTCQGERQLRASAKFLFSKSCANSTGHIMWWGGGGSGDESPPMEIIEEDTGADSFGTPIGSPPANEEQAELRDLREQFAQQESLLGQLKGVLRSNEQKLQHKEQEIKVNGSC